MACHQTHRTIAVIVFALFLLRSSADDPLEFKRIVLSEGKNGFVMVQKVVSTRKPLPKDLADEEYRLMIPKNVNLKTKYSDQEIATLERLFHARGEALKAFLKIADFEQMQVPAVKTPTDPLPYTGTLREMTRITCLLIRFNMLKGNYFKAMETTIKLAKIGHMLEGADGPILIALNGATIKIMAAQEAVRCLPLYRGEPVGLEGAAKKFGQYQLNERGWIRSIAYEYQLNTQFVQKSTGHKGDLPGLYDAEETKRIWREKCLELIDGLKSPTYRPIKNARSLGITRLLTYNYLGETNLSMVSPLLTRQVTGFRQNGNSMRLAVILMLMRVYQLRSGSLPASLQALQKKTPIPLPNDMFTDKPFRFDAEKRYIYSVGADMKDDGGKLRWASENSIMTQGAPDPGAFIRF